MEPGSDHVLKKSQSRKVLPDVGIYVKTVGFIFVCLHTETVSSLRLTATG